MSDAIKQSLFHEPKLGKFDKQKYLSDIFDFMIGSVNLFDSSSKAISFEGELITLQPRLKNELVSEIFNNQVMSSICIEQNLDLMFKRLDFLIFANQSKPIGYLSLGLFDCRIKIVDFRIDTTLENIQNIGNTIKVLLAWLFETTNLDAIDLKFIGNYESIAVQLIQDLNIGTKNNDELNSNQIKTQPIRPKDVNLILTAGPAITSVERNFAANAAAFGWNAHHSDYLSEFEKHFARYVGAEYAVATSSCTGALHLSLLALGIGPGDEVVVPDITWVATASAVKYVGATPVFADVDLLSWTIDIESIKKVTTKKTKAIIPVHLYGYAANMPAIIEFASKKGLFVIEDAAPAIGTTIEGRAAGTFGQIGCFSFQGAKMLVTGEGGMVVTDSKLLYNRLRKLQDHGRVPGTFWIDEIGHKYKLSNLAASIGLAQLTSVERQIHKKRLNNLEYKRELSSNSRIIFQEEIQNSRSICWMTSIIIPKVNRTKLFEHLMLSGIDTRPTFPRISTYPIWGKGYKHAFSNADQIAEFGINLPSGVNITKEQIALISRTILEFLEMG
jgi:perosamine synthetase